MTGSPFPGPRPYRATERAFFFGREALAQGLTDQILARPATTVFGPSGAGKSSLMAAGVIPELQETFDFRVVRVGTWPPGEAPLPRLLQQIAADLSLGDLPADANPQEALERTMILARRRSDRPVLIYLDQLEQLFAPAPAVAEVTALLAALDRLTEREHVDAHVVLSLREDRLGRLHEIARDWPVLWEYDLRVRPLSVGDMVRAACDAVTTAAPVWRWDETALRRLLLEASDVTESASDDVEVQAAFGQTLCLALWKEQAAGVAGEARDDGAETILRRYLDDTLQGLGRLQDDARRLLEDCLVDGEGRRRLLTERDVLQALPDGSATEVLGALERAALLQAEVYQGTRYFELGHDWLASKLSELKKAREQAAAERSRQAEVAESLAAEKRRREEADDRLTKERASRRRLGLAVRGAVGWAIEQRNLARAAEDVAREAEDEARAARYAARIAEDRARTHENAARFAEGAVRFAEGVARVSEDAARTASQMASAWELFARVQPGPASKVLLEVKEPEKARNWPQLAIDLLAGGMPQATLRHESQVLSAAWSPDGRRLSTASGDGTVRVWKVDGSGDPLVLRGHERAATSVAWSPDNRRILTTSRDGTVRVWSADGAGEPLVFGGSERPILSAAWNHNGRRFVTTSRDGTALVWSADGAGEPLVFRGHRSAVRAVAWSPDGKRLVTASDDGTMRVWSAYGPGELRILKDAGLAYHRHVRGLQRSGESVSILWSPNGNLFATVLSNSWSIKVWDADGSDEPLVPQYRGGRILSVAWGPDGRRLHIASVDSSVQEWNADKSGPLQVLMFTGDWLTYAAWSTDGRRLLTQTRDKTVRVRYMDGSQDSLVLRGQEDNLLSVAWSPDGKRLATVSSDNTAQVWNADGTFNPFVLRERQHEVRQMHEHSYVSGAWSPDGRRIITSNGSARVRVWSADGTGEPLVLQDHEMSHFYAVAWSPDGTRLATASSDGTARVWSANGLGEPIVFRGHQGAVVDVAWSPDGRRLATASVDRTARVWKANGSGPPLVLGAPRSDVSNERTYYYYFSVAWSPDGTRLATTSGDTIGRVWNVDSSGEPVAVQHHEHALTSVAWSPDGTRLVTVSEDGIAQVWNADGSGEPTVFRDHWDMFRKTHMLLRFSAVWSPDGRRIATAASWHRQVQVWNADGSGEPLVLRGYEGMAPSISPPSVSWSPDGRHIATASGEAPTCVWDADRSGRPLVLRSHTHAGAMNVWVAWSPDGRRLATASTHTVGVWRLTIPDLQQALREASTDCLTPEQRQTYLDESEADARRAYEACERSHGRTPFFGEIPQPPDEGSMRSAGPKRTDR